MSRENISLAESRDRVSGWEYEGETLIAVSNGRDVTDLKKLLLIALGCAILMLMASCGFTEEPIKDQVKCFTTWDDAYFYLAFKVDCPDVRGKQSKPNIEISGDDAVSVYLQTGKRTDKITPSCFSMTVSSAGGAQFKAGTEKDGLKPETVYTFKYGNSIQGTINNADDIDMGYTIEMAIPWELLKTKSPQTGDMLSINVLVRGYGVESGEFVSLSPKVTTEEDVLNPSKWSSLVIAANSFGAATLSKEKILSAKYIVRAPLMNGQVSDKEWNNNTSFSMDMPLPKGFVYEAKFPVQKMVMTPYYYWYQGDQRKSAPYSFLSLSSVEQSMRSLNLTDFPAKNVGPWFSYDRVGWHKDELSDMAAAGINVVLPVYAMGSSSADKGLDCIICAIDELKSEGKVYPMLGMFLDASRSQLGVKGDQANRIFYGMIKSFYQRVPANHRAFAQAGRGQPANVVVFDSRGNGSNITADVMKYCNEMYEKDFGYSLVWLIGPDYVDGDSTRLHVASVNPGYDTSSFAPQGSARIRERKGGATYESDWSNALLKKPNLVICSSWNEFRTGTDICASRQYGRKYIEATKASAQRLNGTGGYATEYLTCNAPKIIPSKQFAQAELTIRNVGTETWKTSDGIALGYRWYKSGRFFGESKVRRPLGRDVAPGGTITVNIGIATINAQGAPIPEGDAEIRFEMFRTSDNKWFSVLGDQPLMVPVKVGPVPEWGASYLSCSAPVMMTGGQDYAAVVRVRNDGSQPWLKGSTKLGCKLYKVPSYTMEQAQEVPIKEIKAILAKECKPGEISEFAVFLNLLGADKKPIPVSPQDGTWSYQLQFDINNGQKMLSELGAPVLNKIVDIFESDFGPRVADCDVPSKLAAGQTTDVKVVLRNNGVSLWDRKRVKVGYHWYHLDGAELEWDGLTTPIMANIQPGWPTVVKAKVKAPDYDGQYVLVWDVMVDGKWLSTGPLSRGGDILPITVEVTNGKLEFVELSAICDIAATSSDADGSTGDFDGKGNSIPSELMLPDVGLTQEACWLYPSGYNTSTPENRAGNRISFYYPDKNPGIKNAVSCNAQSVSVKSGRYGALHILGASSNGNASGELSLNYSGAAKLEKLEMNNWCMQPFTARHCHSANGNDISKGWQLYHYVIPVDSMQDLTAITLPKNPDMKIFAMTLERNGVK